MTDADLEKFEAKRDALTKKAQSELAPRMIGKCVLATLEKEKKMPSLEELLSALTSISKQSGVDAGVAAYALEKIQNITD